MTRARSRPFALMVATALVSGCAARATPAPASSAVEVVCTAQVEAFGPEYVGAASATEARDEVKRDAKARACAAMQSAEGIDCGDKKRFSETFLTMTHTEGESTTYDARVLVRPVKSVVEGTGRSTRAVDACKAAVSDACTRAPANAACNAAGTACEQTGPTAVRCSPTRHLPRWDPRTSWPLQAEGSPFGIH